MCLRDLGLTSLADGCVDNLSSALREIRSYRDREQGKPKMASQEGSAELSRIRCDYVGAGAYAVLPEDAGVVVNTTYGVQAVGLNGKVAWQVDLGERCLGVAWNARGELLANTLHAVHRLTPSGDILSSSPTRHEVAYAPVPWGDGMLLITLTRIYAMDRDGNVVWKHRFRESLGESVRAVLVLGVLPLEDGIAVCAVDYNSGVGQVICFDPKGKILWTSDVGPLTSLFPVDSGKFVYTLSGYGRFESHCADLKGKEQWTLPLGGPGARMPDGRLAVLVGSNESPKWDNWELRTFTAKGEELDSHLGKGQCCCRPVIGSDGNIYYSSFFKPVDPSESRIDYTSFLPQPAFLAFDYLMRVKAESHQYNVFYFRVPEGEDIELLYEDTASVAFGPTVVGEEHVFFVHNKDLLVLKT